MFPSGSLAEIQSVMFPGKHMASFGGLLNILVVLVCVTRDTVTADLEHTSGDKTLDNLHSTHVLHKRAPGWGKRNVNDSPYDYGLSSVLGLGDDMEGIMTSEDKQWGKRTSESDKIDTESVIEEKRAPGWGKRNTYGLDKKAPGWGKRAPGWGKRAPGWGKRAPGWGKRAPGWGKRAPGWGKRSPLECHELDEQVQEYMLHAIQAEMQRRRVCT
ncbi:cerebral peptide 1-like [Gigantopelta aegis]|uniref:cerebral peptide 1-like n=1 Tax=Gigantopelta aegis TaxID=1735272 RepID=UPI001B88BE28|nr:cerebral peptide 1-like [Gigantopelta aegis]